MGDYAPGLYTAARLIGLEDHRANLADHRDRVRHSYSTQHAALGLNPYPYKQESSIDEMGDLSVSGDTYQYHAPSTNTNWTLPTLALIASLTYLAYTYLSTPEQPPVGIGATVGMEVIPPVNQQLPAAANEELQP